MMMTTPKRPNKYLDSGEKKGLAFDQNWKSVEGAFNVVPKTQFGHSRYSREIGGTGFIPEQPDSKNISVGTTETRNRNTSMDPNLMTDLNLIKLGDSYYHFATAKVNYFKATEFCKKHKMELLSIESKFENDLISNVLRNLTAVDHVWTSGTDLQEEGEFIWLATGQKLSFTNWEARQPDNLLAAEDCIEIHKINKENYAWNDSWCTYKFNFVCEASKCSKFCVR